MPGFCVSGGDVVVSHMTITLSDHLKLRVDAIAARSSLSSSQVIANALESGHSLDRQERFLDKVAREKADAAQFVDDAELDRVVNKCRPT